MTIIAIVFIVVNVSTAVTTAFAVVAAAAGSTCSAMDVLELNGCA